VPSTLDVPQGNRRQRIQKLRRPDPHRPAPRSHRRRRAQWLRQVQHRGRDPLGPWGAERQIPPRRRHAGRDLRGDGPAQAPAPVRGRAHLRRLREGARYRLRGGLRHASPPSRGGQRLFHQRQAVPAQGHPAPLHGHRHRPHVLLLHGAGPDRPGPLRQSRRAPLPLRGGRGHHPLQGPAARGLEQARRRRRQPRAHHRRRQRGRPPDRHAASPGRQGPALPSPTSPRAARRSPP
jgi:hypothetical protein